MGRLAFVMVLMLAAAGCATRRQVSVPPPPNADLSAVAAAIRHGCYRCLETAYADAAARGADALAFEASLLLALRSKELGLAYEPWIDRARGHAGAHSTAAEYLAIVEAAPSDPLSGEREALVNVTGRAQVRAALPAWRAAVQGGSGSEELRAYLAIVIACSFDRAAGEAAVESAVARAPAAPLLQYRAGICDSTHAARLSALRDSDAEYVDADFMLGRYAIDDAANPDTDAGLQRLQSAAAAFPDSAAIATVIGDLYRGWENWPPALAAYDAALATRPDYRDALLGRTVSLSQLARPAEAIDAATRLIEGGDWLIGEAYYWRAWNRLILENYALARADADNARSRMVNAAVFLLSGVIEWRLRRLDTAERELEEALAIDFGQCEAALDLGLVRDQRGSQPESLAAFTQARRCYELSITLRREAIAKVMSGPGSVAAREREAARHQRALAELEARRQDAVRAIDTLERAGYAR